MTIRAARRIGPSATMVTAVALVALVSTSGARPATVLAAVTAPAPCQGGSDPDACSGGVLAVNADLAQRSAQQTAVSPDAVAAAYAQRQALASTATATLPGGNGPWSPYSKGPLVGSDSRFSRVSLDGYPNLGGRVNHFTRDPATGRIYATAGQGGVWALDPGSTTWRSIGDALPTQSVGGIGWSSSHGGTLLITTGNDVFGGGTTFAGLGAYRSVDGGKHWTRSAGVPSGVNSFQVAVDPIDPDVVYAATGAGLFRSTNDGVSYTNVRLPVSPAGAIPNCNGALPTVEGCFLANMVTDVVVRAPGGVGAIKTGGQVIAAVGWRAGTKTNTSKHLASYVEAPGNGLYSSTTGAPGSFTQINPTTSMFAGGQQSKIGRIELGAATGATQDHGYLYAVVQDASGFQGGNDAFGVDAPGITGAPASVRSTYLLGIYSSADFGQTWTLMALPAELALPTTGTSLTGLACESQQTYCPGIQAWYNEWIKPDPTQATAAGVPSRLMFGLEEVWENDATRTGASGPTTFHVIASYTGGSQCFFLVLAFPACPTAAGFGGTTLHADQHDGMFVPDGRGGVSLYTGNDGGVGLQHVASGVDFSNHNWGNGLNNGFNTLMPYQAVVARDGRAYAGLQDNGELRADGASAQQYNTHDGDGTWSAVDVDTSDTAYEAPAGAAMQKTIDGGKTWTAVGPTDTFQFVNPFAMDPSDSEHLLIAGNNVWETVNGAGAWTQVYALGSAPGGAKFAESAIDLYGVRTGPLQPTGPHTPNFAYTDGSTTVPSGTTGGPAGDIPGTYVDHDFTIGPKAGDASLDVKVTWGNSLNDWDVELYKKSGSTLTLVGSSTSANLTTGVAAEEVFVKNPAAGDYVLRVINSTATGTFDAKGVFAQRTHAVPSQIEQASYVAFCGTCDALNARPFANGIATNVTASGYAAPLATAPWHRAKAAGLPERYITSITADRTNPRTVYVTLAGYSRRWLAPGAVYEGADPRTGNVFVSTDAGEHFRNISGNLPDGPAESVLVYKGHLVVGTDEGVFVTKGGPGTSYQLLGSGLPNAPVFSLTLKPRAGTSTTDTLVVATHGRSLWSYTFPASFPTVVGTPGGTPGGNPGGIPGSGLPGTGLPTRIPVLAAGLLLLALVLRRRLRVRR